jgi:glycosyltransferase involved in cell wall biosynthesis
MRIAISLLNFRPGKIGGTETYLRELLPRLPHASPRDELILLASRELAGEITWPGYQVKLLDRTQAQIQRDRILEAFTPYRARGAERLVASVKPDVVFFPQQSMFPKNVETRVAMTVVDIQHVTVPANVNWMERAFRRGIYPYSLRRAEKLLAISNYVKKTLMEYCHVPSGKIAVTLLGMTLPQSDPTSSPPTGPDLKEPFLFYPAASHLHKNHLTLLQTVAKLRQSNAFPFFLVFSGIQTGRWPAIHREIKRLKLTDLVTHVGYVDPQTVSALYRQCAAVLFPSLHEGFGLPVVEAAAHGKKIIVSPLDIYDELGVPQENQIDFSVSEQLKAAISSLEPTSLRRRLPSWDDCAAATIAGLS